MHDKWVQCYICRSKMRREWIQQNSMHALLWFSLSRRLHFVCQNEMHSENSESLLPECLFAIPFFTLQKVLTMERVLFSFQSWRTISHTIPHDFQGNFHTIIWRGKHTDLEGWLEFLGFASWVTHRVSQTLEPEMMSWGAGAPVVFLTSVVWLQTPLLLFHFGIEECFLSWGKQFLSWKHTKREA